MDQPISCQDIYHIYKHPLSILIHQKFQDKDGCSKNGSREFLFLIGILKKEDTTSIKTSLDSRGVPLFVPRSFSKEIEVEDEEKIMSFKNFLCFSNSQIPIVEEEVHPLSHLFVDTLKLPPQKVDLLLTNPGNYTLSSSLCGHVVGVGIDPIHFNSSNFSSILHDLSSLPHLKQLYCELQHKLSTKEFFDEFGEVLGSKLIYLHLSVFKSKFEENESSSYFSSFTQLRSLTLDIFSRSFNPSFNLISFVIIKEKSVFFYMMYLLSFLIGCISRLTQLVHLTCSSIHFEGLLVLKTQFYSSIRDFINFFYKY